MPSLKESKDRIKSIKSTKKMTQAMRMVSAAKFRRLEDSIKKARVYAEDVDALARQLSETFQAAPGELPILRPVENAQAILCVVVTSTRGLCGSLNTNVLKQARTFIGESLERGQKVEVVCIGKKGFEHLSRHYPTCVKNHFDILQDNLTFARVQHVVQSILETFEKGQCDAVHLFYTSLHSILIQKATCKQLLPFQSQEPHREIEAPTPAVPKPLVEYEPSHQALAAYLLPHSLEVSIFTAILDSMASEQGARMVAMDNATKNADEMIRRLTMAYNRKRQSNITKELIEIISGCEALA